MKPEGPENRREKLENIKITPPPVELLLDEKNVGTAWPESLVSNKDFIEQIRSRRQLVDSLQAVFSKIHRPDISLSSAISNGMIKKIEGVNLYDSLSMLLQDKNYGRVLLYLPFEILPDASEKFIDEDMQHSTERFKESYLTAWHLLLNIHDVRANFVDGDVLEVEARTEDLPRVVKAAHLIPKLVERSLVSMNDVISILENTTDEILKQSIADTLPVLADMNLIGEKEIIRLRSFEDEVIRVAMEKINHPILVKSEERSQQKITYAFLQEMLVKKQISTPQKDQGEISEKRFSWLKERSRREAIESVADDISAAVKGGFLDDDVVREIIQNERDATIQSALVVGVRKAIEKNVETDIMRAKLLYARYEETLLLLWSKTTPEIRDELSTLFCRLHGLGIVGDNQLKALGIKIPDLSGSFSENIKSMESEVRDVRAMVEAIETDQQLSKYVYPTVIIYGSRLKGYGKESADIDLAVIVRPETPLNERDNIREKLKKLSHHEKVHGAITEFWLDETKNGLVVYDFEELDPNLGEKSWTHVLFGGAWEGDEKVIAELRRELLVPYFSKTDEIIHGRNARELYLEEMERDTLQYRLMHKGYERFYPSYGGMHTSHAASIDGKSAFWDSGYRIVATKLFANKVFLPEISSSK